MPKDVIEEINDALTDLKAQASAFNESKSKMLEVDARLFDLEQKGARRGGTPAPRTWGEQFIHSDGLKMFGEEHSRPARFRLEVKESTPATITTDAASGGAFGDPARGRIELMPQRQMTVR